MVTNYIDRAVRDVAFYYPGRWCRDSWLKGMLLFFDGVALQVPRYSMDQVRRNPEYASLLDVGVLHLFEPERLFGKEEKRRVAYVLAGIIQAGCFDQLERDDTAFMEISRFQLQTDRGWEQAVWEELSVRGLVRHAADSPAEWRLHSLVRNVLLALYAHIMQPVSLPGGMTLSPATDQPILVNALSELLSLHPKSHCGTVVASDLEAVLPNLGPVSIDELLSFRRQHLSQYRAYARCVRDFAREISGLPESGRESAYRDRREEIRDRAVDLQRLGRTAWKSPLSFALSIAGASWTLATGDPVGALLAAGAAAVGVGSGTNAPLDPYSYLFFAKNRLV